MDICDACVRLEGEECHTPGCRFFLCGMQEVSGYLDRLLIRPKIDGKHTEEVLCEITTELLPLLKTVFGYIEDGTLVRNIADDGKPDWAPRMMRLVRDLRNVQLAIQKAEA